MIKQDLCFVARSLSYIQCVDYPVVEQLYIDQPRLMFRGWWPALHLSSDIFNGECGSLDLGQSSGFRWIPETCAKI